MPQVRMPDGALVNFPDDMPKEQIRGMIAEKFPDLALPQQPAQPEINQGLARTIFDQSMQGATLGFADELTDPIGVLIAATANKINKPTLSAGPALPLTEDVRSGLSPSLGNLYADARGATAERLSAQQEQRPLISTAAQIGGGIATGLAGTGTKAGTAVASRLGSGLFPQARGLAGRAANLLSKAAIGGVTGAASGAAYGAGTAQTGERTAGAKQGAITGGAIGSAVPLAGAAIGAGLSAALPKADEGLVEVGKLAQKYSIPLSIDELTSSRAVKNIQKVSQELPFSGQAKFRDAQMEAFNRAITKSIGQNSTKITPEIMDKAFEKVGAEFDNLGKGKTFILDQNFTDSIQSILDDAAINATDDAVKNFQKGLERVYKNANPDGTISGEKLSFLRSNINGLARKANNPDTAELLKDLENAVIDVMTAGDDVAKEALSSAKYKYKNLLAIEPLAQKAKGGNISPTLLANRVARIYGRQYTRGRAGELGDLARIGSELLPELGGSDTAQKLGYMAATMGAGAIDMGATAAGLGVNRAAQSLINRNPALVNKMIQGSSKQLPPPAVKPRITPPLTSNP